jgi:cullin-associated NEDD8-dissociated protein 1
MSAFNLTSMLDKMRSQDADFRCMALIDFQKEVNKTSSVPFKLEEHAELSLFREVLKLVLEDQNTEVRNLATGW